MFEIVIPEGGFKPNEKIPCIYLITNKKNGKVYVGQTVNYRKRCSDYKNSANKAHCHYMYKTIRDEGPDNFKMEIIRRCDPKDLTRYENEAIMAYDALNPAKGYNWYIESADRNTEETRRKKSLSHMGLKESADTKRKKSNTIYAINAETARFIVCDSGKLFGLYVGAGKDLIKNCLRQPSRIRGWQVYYSDYDKRHEIGDKVRAKGSVRSTDYLNLLDIVDEIDKEGLETIHRYFHYYCLSYDWMDDRGLPMPLYILGTSDMKGSKE